MNRKLFAVLILPILLMINGCTFYNGRIQLYNFGNFLNSHPDRITVSKGDTLYSIARKYNIPIREIIEANNLTPPYTLMIGRNLRLPTAKYHVVSKGDTMYNISKRYNVEVPTLSRLNNMTQPYTLKIGERVILPSSSNITSNKQQTSTWSSSGSFWNKKETTQPQNQTPYVAPKPRKSKFAWPVKGAIISQYGSIGKGRHNDGINIKAPLGTTVKAADNGRVAYAGNELRGFGNLILIKHDDGWVTAYAHNDRLFVKKGQRVMKGEKISTVGSSGGVNTPQLHFEIRSGKKAINPSYYLK